MKYKKGSCTININDETLRVDQDMAFAIYYLNSNGIKTLACCSGHGKYKPTIIIEEQDGKIRELLSGELIPRKKKFYIKDKKGFYYISEVDNLKK